MNYFLFLNHPKGEEIYKISLEKEKLIRRYFDSINTLECEILIKGKKYDAVIDYQIFGKLCNFDCFNCVDDCCADSPSLLQENTKKFLKNNFEEFNKITKNCDIGEELGYSKEELKNELEKEDERNIISEIEEETEMCFYAYRNEDRKTLCSIHSMCLNKTMSQEEIWQYKPLVCSLWPMEIFIEEGSSKIYITLPDDFTNSFTIENYYEIPCINIEISESAIFRKKNPNGFDEKKYVPFIEAYKTTISSIFGEKIYELIKHKLGL
ncbi:hypothetical protein [Fusobacterium sp. MFO224]|uniref:hypothetical protein n=1 Tax=Fusobacterium sp. MFO224 TaxID=3378070 RepID=UPI00385439A0